MKTPVVKVNRNYQVTIPASIRKKYNIEEGDFIETIDIRGGILLKLKTLVDYEEVNLSSKGKKALKKALKEIENGKIKAFSNVDDLIHDLHQ